MIEAAAAGAGRSDHQTIESDSSVFVGIEAVADELSQETAALRIAVPNHTLCTCSAVTQRRRTWTMFHIRSKITHGRKPKTRDWGPVCVIDRFVQSSFQYAAKPYGASIGSEIPNAPREHLRFLIDPGPKRHFRVHLARNGTVGETERDRSHARRGQDVALANDAFDIHD